MTSLPGIKHPSDTDHVFKLGPAVEPFTCHACKELSLGPRSSCVAHTACAFHLHGCCANPLQTRAHPLFPDCTFTLLHEPGATNRVCDCCGTAVLGISYRCGHKNNRKAHDAHPGCLDLPRHISAEGGVHLRLVGEVSTKCGRCGKKEAARRVKGWSYTSEDGAYSYHVACVKEMVLEKYKEGYFGRKTLSLTTTTRASGSTSSTSSTSSAITRVNKNNNSLFGNKTKVVLKIVTLVLKVIVAAIFGNPAAGVGILIESLFS